MGDLMLELKNVHGGYNGIDVIKNINLKINNNEKICIVGPNGSGKSTLLKVISNLISFDGTVLVEGKDIKSFNRKKLSKKIAILTQNYNFAFPYTVYETVALGRYSYITSVFSTLSKNDKLIIEESLKTVGLLDLKDKFINELSGGELQRVFLARTFAQSPEIILLDEPTNHLDLKYQLEMINYIKAWADEKNKVIIAVLHDLNLVYNFADKVILMNKGMIIKEGSPKTVLNSKALEKAYEINVRDFMLNSLEYWKQK